MHENPDSTRCHTSACQHTQFPVTAVETADVALGVRLRGDLTHFQVVPHSLASDANAFINLHSYT